MRGLFLGLRFFYHVKSDMSLFVIKELGIYINNVTLDQMAAMTMADQIVIMKMGVASK